MTEEKQLTDIQKFDELLIKHKDFKFETVYSKKRMLQAYEEYIEVIKDKKLHYGFTTIDNALGGIRPSELIAFIMPTNVGKSALAMNISYNIAQAIQGNVVLFSLEMSEIDIFERFLQMQLNCNTFEVERMFEKKDKAFREKVVEVVERYNNVVSVIKTINVNEISSYSLAIEEFSGKKNSLLIIDYVALIENDMGRNDYEKLTYTMRALKKIALHLRIPILLLSQTDRIKSREGNLDLYSGKGSGEVENSSNTVFTGETVVAFDTREIGPDIIAKVEAKEIRLIKIVNHKKKRGLVPEDTYIILNRKTLKMTEYIPLSRRNTQPIF